MDRLDRSTLIGMLNDDKVYGADLNLFLQFRLLSNKNNEGFKKEDNDIWYYVNTNQNSTCFVDKLRLFFRTIPNADYMYYFNNKDCLLSKIIENKQFNVVYSLIKEKENEHKNILSTVNKNNENILHILLKNVNSADEFMDILNLMLDLIRISENKEDLILKKDKNEKTFMDYFIDNMKNYYQDYEQIQISGYNLSAKIFSDSKEIFAKTNTDYIKELLPYFKWPIDINEDPYELENTFLEIKTIQEKRKIWQSLNAHQSINNCKKRL